MPGYFTKIEVADPHLIPQSVWESLPPNQKLVLTERVFSSQEWEPLDRRRFRIEPESYRTEFSFANVGALGLSRITNSQARNSTGGTSPEKLWSEQSREALHGGKPPRLI